MSNTVISVAFPSGERLHSKSLSDGEIRDRWALNQTAWLAPNGTGESNSGKDTYVCHYDIDYPRVEWLRAKEELVPTPDPTPVAGFAWVNRVRLVPCQAPEEFSEDDGRVPNAPRGARVL